MAHVASLGKGLSVNKKQQPLRCFVESCLSQKKLLASNETITNAVVALKIAGFEEKNPQMLEDKKSLATKIVSKSLGLGNSNKQNKSVSASPRSGGNRITTACIVAEGENCPRCGGPMSPVLISAGGEKGFFCTNLKCRVAAYSS